MTLSIILPIIFIVVGCYLMQLAFLNLYKFIFAAYGEHMKLQAEIAALEHPEHIMLTFSVPATCVRLIVWGSSVGLTLVIVGAALL